MQRKSLEFSEHVEVQSRTVYLLIFFVANKFELHHCTVIIVTRRIVRQILHLIENRELSNFSD